MSPIFLIIVYIISGWLFARIARNLGKSFGLYFVLGAIPIVNFIALIILGNKSTQYCPHCSKAISDPATEANSE